MRVHLMGSLASPDASTAFATVDALLDLHQPLCAAATNEPAEPLNPAKAR